MSTAGYDPQKYFIPLDMEKGSTSITQRTGPQGPSEDRHLVTQRMSSHSRTVSALRGQAVSHSEYRQLGAFGGQKVGHSEDRQSRVLRGQVVRTLRELAVSPPEDSQSLRGETQSSVWPKCSPQLLSGAPVCLLLHSPQHSSHHQLFPRHLEPGKTALGLHWNRLGESGRRHSPSKKLTNFKSRSFLPR